ncbi:MAG: DUF499 domain-containing protein [Candidatus Binataceae bacterium]
MTKLAWTPWHKVVKIRPDLKSGELSLNIFAADLYDVAMGTAKPVYQDAREFFSLTYPTFNLRELAKDVVLRLAGKSEKTVRQLELTYGGGKTHSLIILWHLVSEPEKLPDLPAVNEFIQHIGMKPPKARVAVLPFDKLDVEKGMEVRGPGGETRWLRQPWSVMAFQVAGVDGLKLLSAEGTEEERKTPPAENLLAELLALPAREGLSTLVLIDEVLMFARAAVDLDPAWRDRLLNFFQYLTQAATKVDRCAVIASLLATDPRKSDTLGKEITGDLYAIFRREKEEGVQPVLKDDVAEVLRRRFFTADSIRDRDAFRGHVVAALKGVAELDDQSRKEGKTAEERYLNSYPFHPDLIDVFYSKWTNLEGFQRTRGVLRTFALALRESERWNETPLVSASAFLTDPTKTGISEAARELTTVAATEEYEGKKQEWTGILEGELGKARDLQNEGAGLKFRELEQAVFTTFLHSQPVGQKALTRDLMVLLGPTRPDKIELEKGLIRWAEVSWFLDEAATSDVDRANGAAKQLPKSWRLGSRPNLRQMHHDACQRVSAEVVEARLMDEIGKLKSLTAGASAAGAIVHGLPKRPNDIEDDGEFHFAVLGPRAASDSGKPSAEAKRYIDETTGPDKPRNYRNAVVLAVPSRDGIEAARNRIRDYLGWEEVRVQLKEQLKGQELDPIRDATLSASISGGRSKITEAIQQAYCIVVTVSEKNEIQAFKITVEGPSLFAKIKEDNRARIQDTAISAEALLPEGPYDLWREGEKSRRLKDLVGAFALSPQLPKMLNRRAILDTLVLGCKEGQFVLRVVRPDRSVRTFWRQEPDEASLKDPSLEVLLPEAAELTEMSSELLTPSRLPGLWQAGSTSFGDICNYFSGGTVAKIDKGGYEEPATVPKVSRDVLAAAVAEAVEQGKLWLTSGQASILAEEIPAGLLIDDARLQAPPLPIPASDVTPSSLPEVWSAGAATALALGIALSRKAGVNLPWATVRDAIDGAIRAQMLERTLDSAPWPCDYAAAQNVKLRVPTRPPIERVEKFELRPDVLVAEADLRPSEIQDLAEQLPEIRKAAGAADVKFHLRLELDGRGTSPGHDIVAKLNGLLARISKALLFK